MFWHISRLRLCWSQEDPKDEAPGGGDEDAEEAEEGGKEEKEEREDEDRVCQTFYIILHRCFWEMNMRWSICRIPVFDDGFTPVVWKNHAIKMVYHYWKMLRGCLWDYMSSNSCWIQEGTLGRTAKKMKTTLETKKMMIGSLLRLTWRKDSEAQCQLKPMELSTRSRQTVVSGVQLFRTLICALVSSIAYGMHTFGRIIHSRVFIHIHLLIQT